jgi:hypothetical protein
MLLEKGAFFSSALERDKTRFDAAGLGGFMHVGAAGRGGEMTDVRSLLEAAATGSGYLGLLPRSLVAAVVAELDGPSVARLAMTCRAMRQETRGGVVWRRLTRAQEAGKPYLQCRIALPYESATMIPNLHRPTSTPNP